jgi:hypothetical protein
MVTADKIKVIQDLQCRHLSWLSKYNKALSYGTCPDSWIQNNILISNLIKVIYRYRLFDEPVTNADMITINLAEITPLETIDIEIAYGATILATFSGTGSTNSIAANLCSLINSGTNTHHYYCVVSQNVLYLYTFDGGATFADTPTVTYSESDVTTLELNIGVTSIVEDDLTVVLDTMNCLSFKEICAIITKIKSMLNNCNCN